MTLPAPKGRGKARLFENPVLEALTRTHPAIIVSIYVLLGGGLLKHYHAAVNPSWLSLIGWFSAGIITWTLAEYFIHRYVFHFPARSERGKRIVYLLHGVHHEYPRDKERLIMPPVPSIILAMAFFLLFRVVMGDHVFAFLPGFIFGYLMYASIHYAMHRFRPPTGLEWLWRLHHLHHYKYPDRIFGVSTPVWDFVFGTLPPKEEYLRRKTVKPSSAP